MWAGGDDIYVYSLHTRDREVPCKPPRHNPPVNSFVSNLNISLKPNQANLSYCLQTQIWLWLSLLWVVILSLNMRWWCSWTCSPSWLACAHGKIHDVCRDPVLRSCTMGWHEMQRDTQLQVRQQRVRSTITGKEDKKENEMQFSRVRLHNEPHLLFLGRRKWKSLQEEGEHHEEGCGREAECWALGESGRSSLGDKG